MASAVVRAVPSVAAAAAAAAYLDAKLMLSTDFFLVYPIVASNLDVHLRERRGTLNPFYRLEARALDPSPAVHARCFLHYQGTEWTYSDAYQLVLRHAAWLDECHGVRSRQIVALDFTNKPAFLWLWLGLWALGAVPAFINYNLEGDRLVHCVDASSATLLLVDDEVAHVLAQPASSSSSSSAAAAASPTVRAVLGEGRAAAQPRRIVVFDAPAAAVAAASPAVRPPDSARRGVLAPDPALLIFTSGTTGLPKAAVVSWRKVNYGTGFCSRWMGLRRADRFYTSMPLYHSSAAILAVNNVLAVGCTLVLGHRFGASSTLPELRAGRATVLQYVGETCRYLLAVPPSPDDRTHNLRMAFGNGLRPDVWRQFKERFAIDTICEFYASTEGTSGSWHYQQGEHGIGAVGKNGVLTNLVLGSGVRVVRLDADAERPARDPATGFCIPCRPGEPGEVLWRLDAARIEASFQGYFADPQATSQKILRDCFARGDAWFRTGDVQRRDSDGFWYFVDRIGDTFRWKAENVSTAEVAAVLGTHPAVAECAVYGVALPKHEGRAGCAAVVLRPGVDAQALVATAEETLAKALPRYARPVFIRIVPELEKTGNNKIVKRALQDQGVFCPRTTPSTPATATATANSDGASEDEGRGEGAVVADTWWCPQPGGGYVPFTDADWRTLLRGGVKL